jgi:hypothetical protein
MGLGDLNGPEQEKTVTVFARAARPGCTLVGAPQIALLVELHMKRLGMEYNTCDVSGRHLYCD